LVTAIEAEANEESRLVVVDGRMRTVLTLIGSSPARTYEACEAAPTITRSPFGGERPMGQGRKARHRH
jgi:hypothetical protein